jgi:hypothetical protein
LREHGQSKSAVLLLVHLREYWYESDSWLYKWTRDPARKHQKKGANNFMQTTFRSTATPVLEIAYEQTGPDTGALILLFHGFPYDVREYASSSSLLIACWM